MNSQRIELPLAIEGSTLSYFLSMCRHRSLLHMERSWVPEAQAEDRRCPAPIFVVGCPRSGTTLVGSCLAAHDALAGGHESLFLLELSRIFYGLHQGINRRSFTPLAKFVPADTALLAITEFADRIYAGLSSSKDRCRPCVDHTPWYVGLIPFIDLIYGDAKFVHIVRDGRSVADSLAHSYARGFPWAGKSVQERAKLWTLLVGLGIEFGRKVGSHRYLEVRYEQLCLQPRETIRSIVMWLGYEWDEQVLFPLAVPAAEPSRNDITLAYENAADGFVVTPRKQDSSWPKDWTRANREDFRRIAAAPMAQFGYSMKD